MDLWKWLICTFLLVPVAYSQVPANENRYVLKEIDLTSFAKNFDHKPHLQLVNNLDNLTDAQQVAVLNDYINEVIKNLNVYLKEQNLDPLELPELMNYFEWKILFITYKGQIGLNDGQLKGVSSLLRPKDVTVSYEYPNLSLHMPLGFKNLEFDYAFEATFMGYGPVGNMVGKVKNTRFTAELQLNMITLHAKLQIFQFDKLGWLSLKFTGNEDTDWIADILVAVTLPFIKPEIKNILEHYIVEFLTQMLGIYNGVVCDFLGNC